MRVGGPDGMRLSRAAFAVSIKFSEQINLFKIVWDAVEMAGMTIGDEVKGAARLTEIAKNVR